MAQFSPNTVGYDVAVYKISGFFVFYTLALHFIHSLNLLFLLLPP
jgi:hypothetical protein